jgi:hypothetical protein
MRRPGYRLKEIAITITIVADNPGLGAFLEAL